MPALAGKGVSKTSNIKLVLNGGQKLSFVRSDGLFAFQGVLAGTHLLEVRVDVSSRLQGQVCASVVETGRSLPDSLVLEPLQVEYYYEKREPFSVMGLLKSPMGLMIGFMVVCLPHSKAHEPNWYANYRPFLLRCFSMNECRTMCHCHQ